MNAEADSKKLTAFRFHLRILAEDTSVNRQELREALQREHIREDAYDLNGGNLPEVYTLGQSDGKWVVYYSEHGLETGKKQFEAENEACEYSLRELRSDPTSH